MKKKEEDNERKLEENERRIAEPEQHIAESEPDNWAELLKQESSSILAENKADARRKQEILASFNPASEEKRRTRLTREFNEEENPVQQQQLTSELEALEATIANRNQELKTIDEREEKNAAALKHIARRIWERMAAMFGAETRQAITLICDLIEVRQSELAKFSDQNRLAIGPALIKRVVTVRPGGEDRHLRSRMDVLL